jgi:putative NADH-flavin reductase
MKLTVFAATGGIGRHTLEQAVAAGHDVTAVVRNPRNLTRHVPVVVADLASAEAAALAPAVEGADAVLSCLGPRSKADAGVTSRGTQAIVQAMEITAVRRIVAVSAAPVGTVPSPARPKPQRHDPGDGFFMRHVFSPLLKTVLPEHYADLAIMEDVLRESALDWTVIRPPKLSDKPRTGTYRTAYGQNVRGGLSISRADVAHLMLAVLEQPETIKESVAIAS